MSENSCKKNFWIYTVLFLSIVGNVFMAGILAGRYGMPPVAQRMERAAEAVKSFRSLPPETRDKVKTVLKKELPQVREMLGDIREKRGNVRSVLEQKDYDKSALQKAFDELYQSVDALQLHGQKIVVDMAESLTPEERVALLKAMPKPPGL